MSVIMLVIIAAWAVYRIMPLKWEKQDKEFAEFLSQNGRELLSDCAYTNGRYTAYICENALLTSEQKSGIILQ